MIKQWMYSNQKSALYKINQDYDRDFGFVYAVKIEVTQGFTLLKIGATSSLRSRLPNFGSSYAKLFCVSPLHKNFWENEEIIHAHFSKYRVPARPGKGVQAEFFNLSMPYFLSHLPPLTYEHKK